MSELLKHSVDFYFGSFGHQPYYKIMDKVLDWVNNCFDVNTNRLFVPGQLKTEVKKAPESGSFGPVVPDRGFKVHLYLIPYEQPRTLFGPGGDHTVIAPMSFDQLHSLDPVTLNVILHEFGHVFGVAIGEYYGCRVIKDFTSSLPELKVSAMVPDGYWSYRESWKRDPMLVTNAPIPVFSPLSALVIRSGKFRVAGPPCPDLNSVVALSNYPNSQVVMYRMAEQQPLWTGQTDGAGTFTFPWLAFNESVAVSSDQFRKFCFSGQSGKASRGLSIFDLQYAALSKTSVKV